MSAIEDWQHRRILTIAMMAATLEAGDRAHHGLEGGNNTWVKPEHYAQRAQKLFDAVNTLEASEAAMEGSQS